MNPSTVDNLYNRGRRHASILTGLALGLIFLAAGCKPADIDTVYGRRRGASGAESVNGTAVLSQLFELAGHRVVTWRRLSPKLNDFKTIVWFPDDFGPPKAEQRKFLESWLAREGDRTLVYVGRDYDAAITYWKKVQFTAPPAQSMEVARRLAVSQAIHERERADMPSGESCDWFLMQREALIEQATSLDGPWAAGVDVSKCEIVLAGRLEVPSDSAIDKWVERMDQDWLGKPKYEALLTANNDLAVGKLTFEDWYDSQIIFIVNGSFLLNLPLVNHEHRKLADELIAACGTPGRVAFLESEKGGPTVYDKEPGANAPTGFEVFTVWPLGIILIHLTALGFLACVTLFPIFGRPRELASLSPSDFGQHVEALGELLEQTGDREYAEQRLRIYQENVRRDASSAVTKA